MKAFDLKSIVRQNIWELQAYSSARSEFDLYSSDKSDLTLLDANENPESEQQLNRYPDPLQSDLKEALAQQKGLSVDQIFVGNGSDEAIDLLYRIFCRPGKDKVLICPPTYGMYEVSAGINDIEVLRVPLKEDFSLNDEEIVKRCQQDQDSIKILWICSPNNPTGNSLLKADLKHDWQAENYTKAGIMDVAFAPEFEQELLDNQQRLDRLFGNFHGIIVVDEAYQDFTEHKSFIHRLADYPNLVVLQTMSKAQGLAGARVGFAFASPEIIQLFNKSKPPYNVNELSQKAALKALSNIKTTQEAVKQLIDNRKWLSQELAQFDLVKKVYPSEANFVLAEVEQATNLYNYLKEQGIIIRNRSSQIPNSLRFTVGTQPECKAVIKAMREFQSAQQQNINQ
ncbi:pyridoxal phosphate-dependent aminotransferase [Nonlabens xiamenensis]|uniref:pyridoxal phosphate-dependent aminotransferase n=1 Tax=Nonlabens xiamenensis TaxID=2341043 RepID=UPI000F614531|nr:aminotransferase class I/II-fold pyridoxal phosphate-dependent enzyme [Nonlabens xiamenensis]